MDASQPAFMRDFADIWQAADKIVYSTTLESVSSARTRVERDFNPEAVRQMKASAGHDIAVGGPDLAAHAIKAGLVDECHLFITPVVVGDGKRFLPHHVRLKLELLGERRFGNGVVHLRYRPCSGEQHQHRPGSAHPLVMLPRLAAPGHDTSSDRCQRCQYVASPACSTLSAGGN
jgi:hypothetical protein